MKTTFSALAATAALSVGGAYALPTAQPFGAATELLEMQLRDNGANHSVSPSFDVTDCPGYKLVSKPKVTKLGIQAELELAGEGCHAYGFDIPKLTLAVVSEEKHQLHVHLFDSDKKQYQLPNGLLFDRPSDLSDEGYPLAKNDLRFKHNHDAVPWEWWVERASTNEILFDTRQSKLSTYTQPLNDTGVNGDRNSTAMPAHPLVFENQYLQLSSALPIDANIYGLGEYVTGSFRRDPNNTLQTFFTHDAATPVNSNMYGYHPIYMEARNGTDGKLRTHGVYLQSTAGLDVLLRPGVIQYRAIGGTLDFRFFSGDDDENNNSATSAIQQYTNFIGRPALIPEWSLGFHLCRWGYHSTKDVREVVDAMRAHNLPLETIWSDIDYMDNFRDFTTSATYKDLGDFVRELNAKGQHYVPILDAAIPNAPTNDSDTYTPTVRGRELDVFLRNRNGTEYVGQVWPGYALFVDQQAPNVKKWWNEAVANFSSLVPFSGLWLDMNEQSSFVPGNTADASTNLSDTPAHIASTSVTGWPQGYDNVTWGNSGNVTINGILTYQDGVVQNNEVGPAGVDPANQEYNPAFGPNCPDFHYDNASTRYLRNPPYAIHNGLHYMDGPLQLNLDKKTVSMEAVGVDGKRSMYDVHNLDGSLMEMHVHNALTKLRPNKRPFLISRSTYPGANKYTGHWLGDNFALWSSLTGNETYTAGAGMAESVDGMLSFALFGFSMSGADLCGFGRNTNEELCNRWMTLGAFSPFMRNHNIEGAISQEPYRWDSVAEATRRATTKRYELLPTLYSLLAQVSTTGTPALRALWYDFPDVFHIARDTTDARQFLWGDTLLVSPVFEPNVTEVQAVFPEAGGMWYNIFDYKPLDVKSNAKVNISAPLGEINVHVRPARALLTHQSPQYTTKETQEQPFGLVVNLDHSGSVYSSFYLDDGETPAPASSNSTLTVHGFKKGKSSQLDLYIAEGSTYQPEPPLTNVVLLNVHTKPSHVFFDGHKASFSYDKERKLLNVTDIKYCFPANKAVSLTWA